MMNLSVEDVLSRSFALKKLYSFLRRSVLRPKSPDPEFLDEEAQMLLKDLLDFAAAGIVEALRKIIAAKEQGHNPAIPDRWDGATVALPSVVLPKDGLPGPNTISRQLASGPFSIGISSGELGPRKRLCRVCSREKRPVSNANPSLLENRLFGQVSDTQKANSLRTDAEDHSDRERYREIERSDVAKEVSRRISEIEAGILALQLSSMETKPMVDTYRRQNGIGGASGAVSSLRGEEEWQRPDLSGRFSVKDVNRRERIPTLIDNTEATIANPEFASQSASDDARVSSSGTGSMIRGSRAPSSHAVRYKALRSRSRRQLMSKKPLSAATKTRNSRSQISPGSVIHVNETESKSGSSYGRYKSFKRIPVRSRGHANSRTSRIYESGSADRSFEESRRSKGILLMKRPEKNRRSSPWTSENSRWRSRSSSRYFPSSRSSCRGSSSTFRESYSSPSSREYSADSELSDGLYDKSTSYADSIPSHRGRVIPRRIQDHRRREFETRIQANHEQAVGRLRRLKNKLGLIFHHHHHHHHHHHQPKQDASWKPSQNVFHRKDGGEIIKRSRKGNGTAKSRNHQAGHFRTLLQGLLMHLRRSKKPGTGKMPRNRGAKKLHWWQKLRGQQRRGGTMLPGRGRGKLKLGGRRPLVKAPKMIR